MPARTALNKANPEGAAFRKNLRVCFGSDTGSTRTQCRARDGRRLHCVPYSLCWSAHQGHPLTCCAGESLDNVQCRARPVLERRRRLGLSVAASTSRIADSRLRQFAQPDDRMRHLAHRARDTSSLSLSRPAHCGVSRREAYEARHLHPQRLCRTLQNIMSNKSSSSRRLRSSLTFGRLFCVEPWKFTRVCTRRRASARRSPTRPAHARPGPSRRRGLVRAN